MKLMLIGVNHRTASVELRERWAVPESDWPQAVQRVLQYPDVEEAVFLSTCNRVELLLRTATPLKDAHNILAIACSRAPEEFQEHTYVLRDMEAVRHFFRVTSSLDSMIVGEPQILGQVKSAVAVARSVGAVQTELDAVTSRALNVAKRVRTETQIGSSAVSVASAAVDLAKKIFGSLEGRTVLLVGAGKMGELAARHVMSSGASKLLVINRTYERAVEVAEEFGGTPLPFDPWMDAVALADIIITSTGAPEPIFRSADGEALMKRRKQAPVFFIDIAMPRNVDPQLNKRGGIFVYDLDDLQHMSNENVGNRMKEAERAEAILAEEVQRFAGRLATRKLVPTIVSLQEHLENIRQIELDKIRGRLGHLTPEQECAIEAMTRGIINKVMHTPVSELKSSAREYNPETTTLVEVLRRMFHLPSPDATRTSQPVNESKLDVSGYNEPASRKAEK